MKSVSDSAETYGPEPAGIDCAGEKKTVNPAIACGCRMLRPKLHRKKASFLPANTKNHRRSSRRSGLSSMIFRILFSIQRFSFAWVG